MRRFIRIGAGFAALLVVVAAWAVYTVFRPYQGFSGTAQFVLIPPGASAGAIGQALEANGVVASARLFWITTRIQGQAGRLQAGEYRFDRPSRLIDVATKIATGQVYRRRVTIPEGLTMDEIASLLEAAAFGDKQTWLAEMSRKELVDDLDRRASSLEGYLFPETYDYTRQTGPAQMIEKMVANFRRKFSDKEHSRASQLGMTVREVITLASLIEKETGQASERPLVSAVFHNRLKRGMLLQCDPTVIYAVKRVKAYDNVVNQSDLELDSPYNTYKYRGLPPGPIANPGSDSIQAALYPDAADYLYFVSRNDGTHLFSKGLGEHQLRVQQYQRVPQLERER